MIRIVFMGSPAEVLSPLAALYHHQHHEIFKLVGVVSQPAKPKGRRGKVTDTPVAEYAKNAGMTLFLPKKSKDEDFLTDLRDLKPDLVVTAAYGQILSDGFLAIPTHGTINIHPSLLPQYRGATPVQQALLNGDEITGVSILRTVTELDAGPLITQKKVPILPEETSEMLQKRLFELSSEMLVDAIKELYQHGSWNESHQDGTNVSFCRKILKEHGQMNWQWTQKGVMNRFRAFTPWPGLYAFLGGKRVQLTEMGWPSTVPEHQLNPGAFTYDKKNKSLLVSCKNGWIQLIKLKWEGKKEIDGTSFWNGLKMGDKRIFDE